MGKSLETANTQRMNFSLMAVSQRKATSRVVPKQLTDVRLKATSPQRMDYDLMAVLQQMAMSRAFISWHTDSNLQVTNA